jgi:hypothetical protein
MMYGPSVQSGLFPPDLARPAYPMTSTAIDICLLVDINLNLAE